MIKIIDNFFDDKTFLNIQNHITTKIYYRPAFFDNTKEKNKKNHYGNRFFLINDQNLFDTFVKQTEKKFKINITKIGEDCAVDERNLDHFKPHIDTGAKINILIMLKGPTAVNNGTVFYTKKGHDVDLDIHVGFKENRALSFPSDWVHSQHASNVPNLKRFTSTLFIEDYEDV